MPRGSDLPDSHKLVKLLLLGDSKAGKTHYALAAAQAGYNVLLLDGDVAAPVISKFSAEAMSRVFYFQTRDAESNGMYIPRFAAIAKKLLSDGMFRWNDSKQKMYQAAESGGDTIWEIETSKLNSDWVLVIDSWTSLCYSIKRLAGEIQKVDITETNAAGREVYGISSAYATDLLTCIRNLRCHVIVIGHPDEFVKKKVKPGSVKDNVKDEVVEWTRMVPSSVSRNHARAVATYFTDVAWMLVSSLGDRSLDFRPGPDRDGGGRFDKKMAGDTAQFHQLVEQLGGGKPSGSLEGFNESIAPEVEPKTAPLGATVLNPGTSSKAMNLKVLGGKKT